MEPLPPVKEVEYRCYISKIFDDVSGREYTTFSFETSKEFSNFRYEIAVRYKVEPGILVFRVLGMTATRMMMPSYGTARSILKIPHLAPGQYLATFIKSDGSESEFIIEYAKKGFQILKPIPRKRFIDLIITPSAVMPGGKIFTTVAKAPVVPLVPRTIQKRAPVPLTIEELEFLAAHKSESPDERDAREEMEIFGGKKKLSKKDLAAAEKELKRMGDRPSATKNKKTAKAKPVKKAKAAPKKVVKKKAAKPIKKTVLKPKAKVKTKAKIKVKPKVKARPTKKKKK